MSREGDHRVRGRPSRERTWTLPLAFLVGLVTLGLVSPGGVPGVPSPASPALGTNSFYGPRAASTEFAWKNSTSLFSDLPPAHCCGSMVYDPAANEEVVFGGSGTCDQCNATYVLQGTTWVDLGYVNGSDPAPRSWASMAYDPALSGVVLFGGSSNVNGDPLSDTWLFNGTSWMELAPPLSPSPRWSAGMAWDAQDEELVLFGGYSPALGFLSDTWAFAEGTWTELFPAVSPPPRWGTTMVDDAADGYVLLYGGYSSTQGFLGDTWSFQDGAWASRTGTLEPPPREKAALEFDAGLGEVVLYGGDLCNGGCLTSSSTFYRSDTWTYRAGLWTNESNVLPVVPPPRCCSALSFDPALGELLLLSGQGSTLHTLRDVWTFSALSLGLRFAGLWASPTSLPLGTGVTITVGVVGQLAPPTFEYTSLPPGCAGSNASVLFCVPSSSGTFNLTVEASDAGPSSAVNASVAVTVLAPLADVSYPVWGAWAGAGAAMGMLIVAAGVATFVPGKEGPLALLPPKRPAP